MSTATFNFNGFPTKIQCSNEDKMEDICKKYAFKIQNDFNKLQFLYGGNQVKLDSTFNEIINSIDKEANNMNILVFETTPQPENINNSLVKSKEVICPECGEICMFKIKDFKITLFGCKNKHEKNNIFLKDFYKLQYIDESKIICDNCKNNKSNSYNKQFFTCLTCKKNFCPLCNSSHKQSHDTIDYDKKNYICNTHKDSFISFCTDSKDNLCIQCEQNHKNHNIILFRDIFTNIDDIKTNMQNFKLEIDSLKNAIKTIITTLNDFIFNIDQYYEILNNILNNFTIQNKNYEILYNINEIKNNCKNKEISEINEQDISSQFKNILKLCYKFNNIFDNTKVNNKIINKNNNINDTNSHSQVFNQKLIRNKTEIFEIKKLNDLIKKEEYSCECVNVNDLNGGIFEGTDDLRIRIILKNNGDIKWPVGKAKIQFDYYSFLKCRDIVLFPQNPGEQKNYNIVFEGLKNFSVGQYSSYIWIVIDGKRIGQKIKIIITIRKNFDELKEINENIDKINEFRNNFGLIKFYYPDEKVLEALKNNNFSFERTFESFLMS